MYDIHIVEPNGIEHVLGIHENELQEFIEDFENNYPTEPKISNDLLNERKQLEYYVTQKEYVI